MSEDNDWYGWHDTSEEEELQAKLDIAIRALRHYANDKNWQKTPVFTEWILNPNASLLAKEALAEIESVGKNG